MQASSRIISASSLVSLVTGEHNLHLCILSLSLHYVFVFALSLHFVFAFCLSLCILSLHLLFALCLFIFVFVFAKFEACPGRKLVCSQLASILSLSFSLHFAFALCILSLRNVQAGSLSVPDKLASGSAGLSHLTLDPPPPLLQPAHIVIIIILFR